MPMYPGFGTGLPGFEMKQGSGYLMQMSEFKEMQNCYGLISALLQNSYVGTLTLSISEYNAFGDTVKEHGQSQREVGSRVERGDGGGGMAG